MPYSCSQCGLHYSRMWSLNRHLRKCLKPYDLPRPSFYKENDSLFDEKKLSSQRLESANKRPRLESSSEDHESDSRQSGDQESDNQQSDDENSEIENLDEIDHEVNHESETETSESEDEGEDEINMDEDEKRQTTIKWPLSRTYRINNPWTFWGEMPRIKKHIRWLERLEDAEQTTVVYNIQNASNSQVATLYEIAYNCVKGHIPLERWNLKELRRQRRAVRLLANPDVDMEDKREEILRRGANFVDILLHTVRPLIQFNIPRALKVEGPEEGSDEEEENDNTKSIES